jgi:hypothetical protein
MVTLGLNSLCFQEVVMIKCLQIAKIVPLIIAIGCSPFAQKKVETPSVKSEPILLAENDQTNEKEKALLYYQELRSKTWNNYVRPPEKPTPIKIRIPKTIPPLRPITESEKIITPPEPYSNKVDPETDMMADQKIRFYCSTKKVAENKEEINQCIQANMDAWTSCKAEKFNKREALNCLKDRM